MNMSAEVLTAAITGFEVQKRRIDEQISELRQALKGLGGESAEAPAKGKRVMSAAGRKAIAEAQRRRWAASKQGVKAAAAPAPRAKRKLSKEGRAAIVAALKKRWAAKRAASGA